LKNVVCTIYTDSILFPALYENVTSSTKPGVHNVSHWRQSRTASAVESVCAAAVVTGVTMSDSRGRRIYDSR